LAIVAEGLECFEGGALTSAGIFDFKGDEAESTFEDQVDFGAAFCPVVIGGVAPAKPIAV